MENPPFLEELTTLQEIDQVIALLEDGHWHDLDEIIKKSKLRKPNVYKILEFLVNYNFITLDSNRKEVKVNPSLMNFLKEKSA